jgi:hypothetical protein
MLLVAYRLCIFFGAGQPANAGSGLETIMRTVHEVIEIDKPAETVAEFMRDPQTVPLYDVNVLELAQVSEGVREKGTRDRGIARVAGKNIPFTTEIVEWAPQRVVYRTVDAPMSWTMEFRVDPVGVNKCVVTENVEIDEMGGFFGKIGDAVVTKMFAHDVRASLAKMKELLERS